MSNTAANGQKTVAVIGAGIVGVSTAIWLQRAGYDVILIDRAGPAEGASFGNGGVLASCSVVPVTVPGLIWKAPKMLFSSDQPLFLKWGYLPRLMPWLLRYLSHANADDVRRVARALAPIIGDSLNDHLALARGTGAEKWVVPSDYLFVYDDRAQYEGDAFGWGIRRESGFQWDEMEADTFHAYDPAFSADLNFAARLRGHGRIADPGRYVKDLAAHVERDGGRLVIAEVEDIVRDGGRVTGVRAGGETIPCDAAVVTAGVWSGPLMERLGLHVPLESERGYHVELWEPTVMPKSPVMIVSGKFVMTPMEGRLRLAGIVEFGGTEAPPSRAPFELLKRHLPRVLPGIRYGEVTEWMGHRPAPSDSIPVIGEIPGLQGAYAGFGHHHIGLTGGPKTGQLLARLISGQRPNVDLSPYSPARFARAGQ
ncbi:NAD(P)/FAD-dependent oxidoreductase [Jhaorihella thermophila]|uniref:D-amino-acid dehydrogenase n=1 Tax=Jhaorihella thermophila TaxID=488547 RepID=A0A1H5V0B9_9RHOB|nr:FAD-dependent oxidoreductase [Jhaorihella thermophila]SEF80654.1 D-amino-acid dehydrogenase [Jhaorihella thermophila]